jgi:DHA2 family multidrug resistance protein
MRRKRDAWRRIADADSDGDRAMFDMTRITGEVDFRFFMFSRMLLSVGLPFVFIPILTASFDGIPHNKTDMASALINMARNTGGSIGISLANNVLAHRQQFHQSRLVELVNTSTVQFQAVLKQAMDYFMAHGSSLALAQQQAFTWIARQVQTQSTLLAHIDVFWALMLISAAAVPLALTLRKVRLRGPVPVGH